MPRTHEAIARTPPPELSGDVVQRAQKGDVSAFESIYRASAPAVFSLCMRMTGNEAEARELTQDAFVRAWERLESFRGQSSLQTWLHRLTANVVLEHFRTTRRETARMLDSDDAVNSFPTTDLRNDTGIDLEEALLRLPEGARVVFVLFLEGYSHEEIGRMTGIAAGTARAQLWRARRALAALIER